MELPPDTVMREMAKLANEMAFEICAKKAEAVAEISAGIDGRDALLAFARAIRETNRKVWPAKGKSA